MGNAASKYTAYAALSRELPPVKKMEYDSNYLSVDKGMKVFADDQDREQFIYAVLAVATSNGALDLSGASLKVFYSRPSSNGQLMIASLAAIREGKIVAKIEPVDGGEDQRAAFLALRRDVEVQLDRILKTVPSASRDPAATDGPSTTTGGSLPFEAPPAYQSPAVDMVGRKEKA